VFDGSSEHARTIRARNATSRLMRARLTSRFSSVRSSSVTTSSTLGRPVRAMARPDQSRSSFATDSVSRGLAEQIPAPDYVREMRKQGQLARPTLVAGEAIFTLYGLGAKPLVNLPDINRALQLAQEAGLEAPERLLPRLPSELLGCVRYPTPSDQFRLGFLYPLEFSGFYRTIGSSPGEVLPVHRGIPVVVETGAAQALDGRRVRFRGIAREVSEAAIASHVPGLTSEAYDAMSSAGETCFIDIRPSHGRLRLIEEHLDLPRFGSFMFEILLEDWSDRQQAGDTLTKVMTSVLGGGGPSSSRAQCWTGVLAGSGTQATYETALFREFSVLRIVEAPYLLVATPMRLGDASRLAHARSLADKLKSSFSGELKRTLGTRLETLTIGSKYDWDVRETVPVLNAEPGSSEALPLAIATWLRGG
jgi:hypothetical protein